MLARRPHWQLMSDKALHYIRRHPDIWVLGFRFVYGLRTVMPVAIGLSGYPLSRYLILNGIGASVWAASLGAASYHFGALLEGMLGSIRKYEIWVMSALVILGFSLWSHRRFKKARIVRQACSDAEAQLSTERALVDLYKTSIE